jgi:4-carboxymuconolactone decarboxylase
MRAEAMPRGGRTFGFERFVAQPAEAFIIETHAEPPFPDDAVGEAARPMPAISAPQPFDEVENPEYLGAVANHLTVAGLAPAQDTVAVDHERRAPCDVAIPIEDAVGADHRTMQVAQERKRELGRGREGGVAGGAVAADREHGGAALACALGDLDEAAELGGSNAAPVETVKDQHHVAPAKIRQPYLAGGRRQREVGRGLTEAQVGHRVAVYPSHARSARPKRAQDTDQGEDTMKDSETYRKGAEMRRRLLGDAFVDRSTNTVYADPVMGKFIDVATEAVFGMLWTRPGLDLKTRTLVCVISDAATGREPELAIHLRMALRQGWTEEELTEALIQLVGYVGAPYARDALIVASRVFGEMRAEGAKS